MLSLYRVRRRTELQTIWRGYLWETLNWVGQKWTITFDFMANRRPPERILQCNGKKTGLGARILGFSYWLCLQLSAWLWPGSNQLLLLTTMLWGLNCYLHMIDEAVRGSRRLPKVKEQVSVKAKLQAQVYPTLKSTFLLHKWNHVCLHLTILRDTHMEMSKEVSQKYRTQVNRKDRKKSQIKDSAYL